HTRFSRDWSSDVSSSDLERIQRERARWCQSLMRLRKDVRLLAVYDKQLLKRVVNGRIHAGFLLHGASTGRISSREPNLQNIPARSEERRVGKECRYGRGR